MKKLLLDLLMCFSIYQKPAQFVTQINAANIYQDIKALNVSLNVLFVTMKPGDEDAQLMAYLSKHIHANVGLLMLTRGEAMPNYAGYETTIDLGIIHSQEMAKAASVAGYSMMTTSAMDIGDYDSAANVFKMWDKDALLSNIVSAIRAFRPDVIVVPDKNNTDSTSEILLQLVKEANERSGNRSYYPVQLAGRFSWLAAVSAKEIFVEISDSSKENRNGAININTNIVDEAGGLPYKEIAKQSYLCERSVFKNLDSICFRRDTQYLKPVLSASTSLFEHTDSAASRNSDELKSSVNNLVQHFDFLHPENSLAQLTGLYQQIANSTMEDFWKKMKLEKLQKIILACSGIRLKAFSDKPFGVVGRNNLFHVNITNNLSDVEIKSVQIDDSLENVNVSLNKKGNYIFNKSIYLSFDKGSYQPFWLDAPIDIQKASYYVPDTMMNKLLDPACFSARINLLVNNLPLTVRVPVMYEHFDRMNGAVSEPFYTIQPVQVSQTPTVLLTNITGDTKENKHTNITLKFRTLFDSSMYTILQVQEVGKFAKDKKGAITSSPKYLYHSDTVVNFKYNDVFKINIPFPEKEDATLLTPSVLMRFPEGCQSFDANIKNVDYPYIPAVIYNYHDETNVVNDLVKTRGKRVGYIFGLPEDALSNALSQLGYKIDYLNLQNVAERADSLSNYDAILIGNILPIDEEIDTSEFSMAKINLDGYVYHGGSLISLSHVDLLNGLMPLHLQTSEKSISYNPNTQLISISDSSMLRYPNKVNITKMASWKGQLFYGCAENYDKNYQPVLKLQDKNADNSINPFLYASLGTGLMIYCNLDLPLQTANAQPDAFKILANLIAAKFKRNNANRSSP